MGNPLDALVYATIKNNASSAEDYADFKIFLQGSGFKSASADTQKETELNKILDQTTIKRACCLQTDTLDVRIPIPKEIQDKYDAGESYSSDEDSMFIKYGFFDKSVTVPENLCPTGFTRGDVKSGDPEKLKSCDDFMEVYCRNSLNNYKKANEGKYKHSDFILYKPECSCFGDTTKLDAKTKNFPRKCLFMNCGTANSYEDNSSRGESCSLQICNSIIDASGADAGGDITINAEMKQ